MTENIISGNAKRDGIKAYIIRIGAMNFKVFNREDEIKYGVEVLGFRTNFQFYNSLGREYKQEQNTSEIAGYTSYKKVWKKVVIEPGLRLHYYASLSVANVEPRLGFKWNINDNWRFKLAAGRYSQNLVAANSDRDVVGSLLVIK